MAVGLKAKSSVNTENHNILWKKEYGTKYIDLWASVIQFYSLSADIEMERGKKKQNHLKQTKRRSEVQFTQSDFSS